MKKKSFWGAIGGICMMAGCILQPIVVCAEGDAAAQMEKILNGQKEQEEEFSITPMNAFLRTNAEANVRSGPDTAYESLGKTEIGQDYMVTGISEDGKWYQVYMDGQEAFIAAEYMEEIPIDEAVDAELKEGFDRSGDEVEAELLAEKQEAAEQEAAEQQAAMEQETAGEQSSNAQPEKSKANVGLIIAVVFITVFLISMLTLLKKDQQQEEQKEEREKLDIIDLEEEPLENDGQEKVPDQTEG